ncbi:MAG: multidrug efflux RND transporter permease subunit [Puniceicoccales bacterium]|jgi:multidrug efflux pump|nr:multidrug efflux RND transporter permease subunit [Puniceicoccales bacterium]
MARFFIDRPVFAWVIAIFLMVAGVVSIRLLPIAQYPTIASPTINVNLVYPGATAEDFDQTVTDLIVKELRGIDRLRYVEASSEAAGRATISATFLPGTNQDLAAVDVQNRIKRVEPRLPQAVLQQGVQIEKSNAGFLCMIGVYSPTGTYDNIGLGDYVARNILDEIKTVPGVGQARAFAPERAMRIWIDPQRLVGLGLSVSDVTNAISTQNVQVSAGTLGVRPTESGTQSTIPLTVTGQLRTEKEFGDILLRSKLDTSTVRLRDVARIEMGGSDYGFQSRLNGRPTAGIGVQTLPTANALETATNVRRTMERLARYFPRDAAGNPEIAYELPFDTTPFISLSMMAVVRTLLEAILLVFIVMFIFLQNIRYTFIPIIVVPIALLGTFAVLLALDFSINVLTMFGMVLVIGILVDDAIVVVENVERIMREEHLPPREATQKAMRQITGAIIGMTLVLASVFIPMAFFSGAVGVIYRQFALTMVASILFSALLALTLTPALCANLLQPHDAALPKRKGVASVVLWLPDFLHRVLFTPFFRWFNRNFGRLTSGYERVTRWVVRAAFPLMLVYAALTGAFGYFYQKLPPSFIPMEDQGTLLTLVQLPSGASANRTDAVFRQIEAIFAKDPAVKSYTGVMGFSFSGMGENAGMFFVSLKPWDERGPEDSAEKVAARVNAQFGKILDVYLVRAIQMPPIPELGITNGVDFRLQDRAGQGRAALLEARNMLYGMILQDAMSPNPVFGLGSRPDGLEDSAQILIEIDRDIASAMGVSFAEVRSAIGIVVGSAYVNDFPNKGRMQRVIVQADQRLTVEDIMRTYLRNDRGEMVPLGALAKARWIMGATQAVRYNGYPAMRFAVEGAPGRTTGEVMNAVHKLEQTLLEARPGFAIEWTKQALEEEQSGNQAPYLIALSLLFVFLLMAALYESWSIPLAVMLVVPIGALGSVLAVTLRGMPNDIYFLIGLIAIIGLSTKNAILIIEFAKEQQLHGKDLLTATIEGARLRFRPILMTSFAFVLGVLPLFKASGAASASQRAIGTGVIGGMLAATLLGVLLIPAFYVVIRKLTGNRTSHYDHVRQDEWQHQARDKHT